MQAGCRFPYDNGVTGLKYPRSRIYTAELSLLVSKPSAGVKSDRIARSQASSTAGSVKTAVGSIFILSVLLLSSAFLIDLSQKVSDAPDSADVAPSPALEPRGSSGVQWDWDGFADGSGFVDVILMLPADAATHDPF